MITLNRFKKHLSILLVLVMISSKAFGILPLAFGVGIVTGIETGLGTALVTSAVLHGAALFGYLFWDDINPSAPTSSPVLHARLNPKAPLPTPPGWGDPVAPSIKPLPPSTSSVITSKPVVWSPDNNELRVYFTPEEACATYTNFSHLGAASSSVPVTYQCVLTNGYTGNTVHSTCKQDGIQKLDASNNPYCEVKKCEPGYTLSGDVCNLSDSSKVMEPEDGRCMVMAVGNGFELNLNDPDCAAARIPSNVKVQAQSITATSADGQTTVKIEKNAADGSSTMTVAKSRTDGSNKTDINTISTTAPDGNGVVYVNGTSSSVVDGTGVLAGADSGTSIDNMPTDYNREATQQELKDAIKNDIQSSNDAKNALGTGPDQPTYDASELGLPGQDHFQVAPTSGFASFFPSSDGECVTLSVNLPYFPGLVLNPCSVVTAVRPLIDWGIMALGLLSGIFVWFGRTAED
jgi:hypothetical protein